jgi:hypothetical protein
VERQKRQRGPSQLLKAPVPRPKPSVERTLSRSQLLQRLFISESELIQPPISSALFTSSLSRLKLTFPDLTTSWSFELIDSEFLADLDFLTGAMLDEVLVRVGGVGLMDEGER